MRFGSTTATPRRPMTERYQHNAPATPRARMTRRRCAPSGRGIGISSRPNERLFGVWTRAFVALAVGLAMLPSLAFAGPEPTDRLDGRTPKKLGVPVAALPDVSMKAGALVAGDGRVLWARRPDDRRAMASITKIMTAVVAMENSDLNEEVTVPSDSRSIGESTSYLRAGEKLPMSELLEALLVKSGNDAAIAIAEHVSGDEDRFVALMNAKAGELGLSHTRFANPHGLDAPGHYSSASDLSVLARYAMSKPEFRRIVGERYAMIDHASGARRVENTNLLLGNYDGAIGIKTGWTSDAGYSVLGAADRMGVPLYAVILGTATENQRFKDARELLDWGFAHYRPQKLATVGTVVGEAVVTDYLDRTVSAAVSRDSSVTVFDLAGPIKRSVVVSAVKAPVKKGQRVGVARFTQGDQVVDTVPLVATEDVSKPNVFSRAGIAIVRAWRRLTIGADAPMTAAGSPAVSY